jgi:hypothetical protein
MLENEAGGQRRQWMEPYEYLVGKLAQVEVATEDFEAVAEDTAEDAAMLLGLNAIRDKLLLALEYLERDGQTRDAPSFLRTTR